MLKPTDNEFELQFKNLLSQLTDADLIILNDGLKKWEAKSREYTPFTDLYNKACDLFKGYSCLVIYEPEDFIRDLKEEGYRRYIESIGGYYG